MTNAFLEIAGKMERLTSVYTLRFVDRPGDEAEAVLYRDGKRVAQAWSLTLFSEAAEDKGNANTT